MSFGWSAGDIATAVTVVYNLVQALDSCDGAAGDYRETVSFLQDLKRTLEPLQSFTAWNVYPLYGRDITEHVGHIKVPVEQFRAAIQKFEPSLGTRARDEHHRHIARKLQWHIFISNKVLRLKRKIESHMRIIDTLMQRLTLDVVWTTQQKLPDTLRDIFKETLRPELIAALRDHLPPLTLTLHRDVQQTQSMSPRVDDSKLLERYEEILSGMDEIRQQISRPNIMTKRIESSLRGFAPRTGQKMLANAEAPKIDQSLERVNQSSRSAASGTSVTIFHESLQEVYYLVFLYLGQFLKELFLLLSRLVQPTRELMPVSLAKYNISFLDAIGRPLRILPYEYFRSFKVLQAFIQHEFKDLPGSVWVDRGRYLILSLNSNQVLNERNWASTVVPGTTIAMSMLLQKRLTSSLNNNEQHCPQTSCSGKWKRSNTQSWATCPVCKKEIFNSVLPHTKRAFAQSAGNHPKYISSYYDFTSLSTNNNSIAQQRTNTNAAYTTIEGGLQFDDEISAFKRVVQQYVESSWACGRASEYYEDCESCEPVRARRLACPFCMYDPRLYLECMKKSFTTFGHLKQHLNNQHKLGPNHCTSCRQTFDTAESLTHHDTSRCVPTGGIPVDLLGPSPRIRISPYKK